MKARYTEAQIAFAMNQIEEGHATVAEMSRKLGVSNQSIYKWRKKYTGLGPVEIRRLKALEEENRQLKKLVADLSLDKHMLQDVLSKKF